MPSISESNILFGLLNPELEGTKNVRNVCNYLPDKWNINKDESSTTPLSD
jgi:hypothetical protein